MNVYFHEDFYREYTSDPAAEEGRMESVIRVIENEVTLVTATPASEEQIALAHTPEHIDRVREQGLYSIAALAAGGAIQTATTGLTEPAFGLIRPPGHHASSGGAWGFCFFNNMAIALEVLKKEGKIDSAYVLDIDMHYGDGTVNILKNRDYVTIHNVETEDRKEFIREIEKEMENCTADIIGISAGFDNHVNDWGGVLFTGDYEAIGRIVAEAARRNNGGCFAILEGGYNHEVLGYSVMSLIRGMQRFHSS